MAPNLDYSKITDVEIEGIDTKDAPDFCDAYVQSALYDGRPMTEEELESLDRSWVHQQVEKQLY